MIRVKICGMTSAEGAIAAGEAGADAVGLIFVPGVRRYLTVERAQEIAAALPPFVARVGVFIDEAPEKVEVIARRCSLDTLQLHGRESPEYCRRFAHQIIKSIRVADADSLKVMDDYRVDAFLLEPHVEGVPGGAGRTFDWRLAAQAAARGRIILAGGLTPENVTEALERVRPFGVDVSSGVE
ncbi:MAG: phosphoribosylanthranilate isomerase, partial [Armatimonadetes bacterium]|nr:phosphoribosylanthranilate isomerase [Armatimonadota bacterium]